jgi:sigma-E factor negative regulatory protein RseA
MMNEDPLQSLSLLLDGECSGAEMQRAIDRLLADSELQQCWERFHLAGHVLRGDAANQKVRLVARQVVDSLAGLEPVQPGDATISAASV